MKFSGSALLFCSAALWTSGAGPAPAPADSWVNDVAAAKPYQLELRFGETYAAFPDATPMPDFLRQAGHVAVAIAENDQGSLITSTAAVTYRLHREKHGRFSFRLSYLLVEGGTSSTEGTQSLSVPEDEWVVVASKRSQEPGHPAHLFYVVVRIRRVN